ncbi:hypothetical protein NTGHW29_240059 [Candidatus Nitrotoga sp. HW29]|uniref:DUF2726 domain-containing protein n=1 Tax=Candidatus Nitrotoga sp. HW29 TaxID=2886963 RepID=UPI001EF3251D|nr:DUF2726 domain-containing protein [Candidatus Nitrotoga sp. HW29]CAH1904210.1 hypothetical protein NTGHW29_240059 [Candidatus Nitrotoga sp. HW29]
MFNGNKKNPLSERERETLKILRETLPEYEIHANMRLADVIKADWKQFNHIKGYHLDFVICNKNGHTAAAIELDDSTHDNPAAQLRDAKKNKFLRDADIKLIRIREPKDAIEIKKILDESQNTGFSDIAWNPPQSASNIRTNRSKKTLIPYQKITFTITCMLLIWIWVMFSNTLIKSTNQKLFGQQNLKLSQSDDPQYALADKNLKDQKETTLNQPKYERQLIRAKSARECARVDGTLDNYTALCMRDHEEMVLITN